MPTITTGLLTLTPTHPGTGQTSAAIDLPIARDPSTGMPILPASMLKGVARAAMEAAQPQEVKRAFGPKEGDLVAGTLVFGEGQLLLYPLRALHRPVAYATCPLLLRRWDRSLRAMGAPGLNALPANTADAAIRAWTIGAPETMVVEDMPIRKTESRQDAALAGILSALLALLPAEEPGLRDEMKAGFVLLSDTVFSSVMRRAIPVQTRIKLNDKKTTTGDGGNMWTEEYLPAECLFGATISDRTAKDGDTGWLGRAFFPTRNVQLGGNETVGMGRVAWTAKRGEQ